MRILVSTHLCYFCSLLTTSLVIFVSKYGAGLTCASLQYQQVYVLLCTALLLSLLWAQNFLYYLTEHVVLGLQITFLDARSSSTSVSLGLVPTMYIIYIFVKVIMLLKQPIRFICLLCSCALSANVLVCQQSS